MATWEDVRTLGLALPEAEEGTAYGERALKVRGKSFAHMSPHEDGALVLRVDRDERPLLIESRPSLYFVTPHYENYAYMLVRLDAAKPGDLRDVIEDSWLAAAPKRLAATLSTKAADSV
jgi:hypothetical protein